MATVFHSLATQFPGEFQQIVCTRVCARVFGFNLHLEPLCSGKTNLRELRRRCRCLLPGSLGLVESVFSFFNDRSVFGS